MFHSFKLSVEKTTGRPTITNGLLEEEYKCYYIQLLSKYEGDHYCDLKTSKAIEQIKKATK